MVDLTRREAIAYLNIREKHFDNYVKSSNEIAHYKKSNRYYFTKNELDRWKDLRDSRTVYLSMEEYQKCFILAIQMAYTKKPSAGTGIRGVRSEMQVADDWILGIMAEFALKKFLKEKYQIEIELDTEPHPKEGITAQVVVTVNGKIPNLKVAMKASKEKNCWIVLDPLEYNDSRRSSDVHRANCSTSSQLLQYFFSFTENAFTITQQQVIKIKTFKNLETFSSFVDIYKFIGREHI